MFVRRLATMASPGAAAAAAAAAGVVQQRIVERLTQRFQPAFLSVINESGHHAVPRGVCTCEHASGDSARAAHRGSDDGIRVR
jgi:stress-induced morphogen